MSISATASTIVKTKKTKKSNVGKEVTAVVPNMPSATDLEITARSGSHPVEDGDGGVPMEEVEDPDSTPTKKRKRDLDQGPELEIDIKLPEPPSKKALRKAKKQKTLPDGTVSKAKLSEAAADQHLAKTSTNTETTAGTDIVTDPTAASRSPYGIWIGNLAFGVSKPILANFFTENAPGKITEAHITRLHMPPPENAKASRTQIKPLNKGFAYVDFSTQEAVEAAVALSESVLAGRNVLIKYSKDFQGRPEKETTEEDGPRVGKGQARVKQPSKRVFVGNLGFDATTAELREHFQKCGTIENIHMATFEDSGKCKGFAWVTFDLLEASEAAVRGWVKMAARKDEEDSEQDEEEDHQDEDGQADVTGGSKDANKANETEMKPKRKFRKWFVNRLQGRTLRCEFAEDATTRYKKRFGKEAKQSSDDVEAPIVEVADEEVTQGNGKAREKTRKTPSTGIRPGAPTDASFRRGKGGNQENGDKPSYKKKSGSAAPDKVYRTGVITESTGKKITF